MPDPVIATRRRRRRSGSGYGRLATDSVIVPSDPIVSIYPQPMDSKRAREEAVRARRLRKKLPLGHPYRNLPLWLPYWLVRLINNSAPSSKPAND